MEEVHKDNKILAKLLTIEAVLTEIVTLLSDNSHQLESLQEFRRRYLVKIASMARSGSDDPDQEAIATELHSAMAALLSGLPPDT